MELTELFGNEDEKEFEPTEAPRFDHIQYNEGEGYIVDLNTPDVVSTLRNLGLEESEVQELAGLRNDLERMYGDTELYMVGSAAKPTNPVTGEKLDKFGKYEDKNYDDIDLILRGENMPNLTQLKDHLEKAISGEFEADLNLEESEYETTAMGAYGYGSTVKLHRGEEEPYFEIMRPQPLDQ